MKQKSSIFFLFTNILNRLIKIDMSIIKQKKCLKSMRDIEEYNESLASIVMPFEYNQILFKRKAVERSMKKHIKQIITIDLNQEFQLVTINIKRKKRLKKCKYKGGKGESTNYQNIKSQYMHICMRQAAQKKINNRIRYYNQNEQGGQLQQQEQYYRRYQSIRQRSLQRQFYSSLDDQAEFQFYYEMMRVASQEQLQDFREEGFPNIYNDIIIQIQHSSLDSQNNNPQQHQNVLNGISISNDNYRLNNFSDVNKLIKEEEEEEEEEEGILQQMISSQDKELLDLIRNEEIFRQIGHQDNDIISQAEQVWELVVVPEEHEVNNTESFQQEGFQDKLFYNQSLFLLEQQKSQSQNQDEHSDFQQQ